MGPPESSSSAEARVSPVQSAPEALRSEVAANPLWYHTLELAPGVTTPGWFDLRHVVDRIPWPGVRGKRCLDIGTYDGFLAFELERRGAAEVVATDVSKHEDWDWPPDARRRGPEFLAAVAGPDKGRGFDIARRALGSSVERREISIYDLSPQAVGRFDVVVCGSLLVHLRDPLGGLEAVRSVCSEHFLSIEPIDLASTVLHRRTPLARLEGERIRWWRPNAAGHRRMLWVAGFSVERSTRFASAFGPSHSETDLSLPERVAQRLLTGGIGVPTAAVLAHPRL